LLLLLIYEGCLKIKLIVDVPSGFLKKIQEFIQKGKYSGIEEFLEIALLNQLKLEEIGTIEDDYQIIMRSGTEINKGSDTVHQMAGPLFSNLSLIEQYNNIITADPPSNTLLSDGPLWGQYNRIFPIKITLRLLANLLSQNPELELKYFRENASDFARRLGMQLLDVDKTKKRTRGERLSTALPVGENPFKSKNRFKNHFIGYVDNRGVFQGAPGKLKFVSFHKKNAYNICITRPGLEFSLLKNPILDGNISNGDSLSEEEKLYYIEHIKNHVPSEYDAMMFILTNISEGHNRPDDLTQILQKKYANWTKSQANTIRSGLLSRMFELGLIYRDRLGLREIKYVLSIDGIKLINLYINKDN